jgi:hypothetical protein
MELDMVLAQSVLRPNHDLGGWREKEAEVEAFRNLSSEKNWR